MSRRGGASPGGCGRSQWPVWIGLLAAVPVVLAPGCGRRTAYTATKIEMAIMDEKDKNGDPVDMEAAIERLYFAGPLAVPELAPALESEAKLHRLLAGEALRRMTLHWEWAEAYDFVAARISGKPQRQEAYELLYAVAHEGIASKPDLAPFVAEFLDDGAVVRTLVLNSPDNQVQMRACDYAAYIIRTIAGEDTGSSTRRQNDQEIAKAKAWDSGDSGDTTHFSP